MKNYYIVAFESVVNPESVHPKHTSKAAAKRELKTLANHGRPTLWKIFKVTTIAEEVK